MYKQEKKKDYIIKQFGQFNTISAQKLKNIDVLISMTWGKSIWGENLKIDIPKTKNLKLIHLQHF